MTQQQDARIQVLVADDVAPLRRLVRRILDRDGRFEVVAEAEDGLQAIKLARDLQPDVVILDIMMPEYNGLEALPRIREESPGSRVLVFTGVATGVGAPASGADAYLEKGASSDQIIASLEQISGLTDAS